ncbi:MAG: hypothetical protein EA377_13525, partial [Phycisphaerales bacterium]
REQAQRDLAQPIPTQITIPDDATIETLRQLRDQAEADLNAARQRLIDLEAERDLRVQRRAEIPAQLAQARSELEDVEQQLAAAPLPEQLPEITESIRTERRAHQIKLNRRIEALVRELANYDARTDVLPLRLERAARRITARETILQHWRSAVEQRATADVERQAEETRRALADAHPSVRSVVEENLRLIEKRTAEDSPLARLPEYRRFQGLARSALLDLISQYERDRQRIETATRTGLTDARLRTQRAELVSVRRLTDGHRRLRSERAILERERVDLEYELRALPPIEQQRTAILDLHAADVDDETREMLAVELEEQLAELRENYLSLIREYREAELLLEQIDRYVSPLITLTREYQKIIDERILWIRSTDPLTANDRHRLAAELRILISLSGWMQVLEEQYRAFRKSPVIPIAVVLGLIVWYLRRVKRTKRMRELADLVGSFRTDSYQHTAEACAYTLTNAFFWPVVLWYLAWQFQAPLQPSERSLQLSAAFERLGWVTLLFTFLFEMTRRSGLARNHFRWHEDTRIMLRRNLRWLVSIVVPLSAILAIAEWDPIRAGSSSLGRVSFIAIMLVLSVFILLILRPSKGLLRHVIEEASSPWLERTRYIWFWGFALVPLALGVLAASGYFYTAMQLDNKLLITYGIILFLILSNGLVLRWLFILRRNMAVEEARKRREEAQKKAQAANATNEDGTPIAAPPVASTEGGPLTFEEPKLDLNAISEQARKLLRTAIASVFIIGLWITWSNMLPALSMLDRFEVWPNFGNIREADVAVRPADHIVGRELVRESLGSHTTDLGAGIGLNIGNGPLPPPNGFSAAESVDRDTVNAEAAPPAAPVIPPAGQAPGTRPFTNASRPFDRSDAERLAPDPQTGHISLTNVLLCALIIIVIIVIGRNIPGLLEITILSRLPLEPSGRYAIVTLTRYVIIILGTIMAFGAIGIGWSEVQWLVAAITLGIGFGLQEIVANFISGIIILFEQPIRVGDTVTVNNTSGTVTKIRMRATTIVDWDRKEIIIPNKTFITGDVINWTLNDPVLRVVIPVGIAYGSDTVKAEQTLLRLATDHPIVLKDPAPSVVFSEFGDSSLNFNLRMFIPHISELIKVRHEMHRAIDLAFREAGIEIAFPQRDIHVRTIHSALSLAQDQPPKKVSADDRDDKRAE